MSPEIDESLAIAHCKRRLERILRVSFSRADVKFIVSIAVGCSGLFCGSVPLERTLREAGFSRDDAAAAANIASRVLAQPIEEPS